MTDGCGLRFARCVQHHEVEYIPVDVDLSRLLWQKHVYSFIPHAVINLLTAPVEPNTLKLKEYVMASSRVMSWRRIPTLTLCLASLSCLSIILIFFISVSVRSVIACVSIEFLLESVALSLIILFLSIFIAISIGNE